MMTGFEQYTKKTRRAIFLEEMEQVVPWRELCALVSRIIPSPGTVGRRWFAKRPTSTALGRPIRKHESELHPQDALLSQGAFAASSFCDRIAFARQSH